MPLLLSQSDPETVGNLALAPVRQAQGLREPVTSALALVREVRELVSAEDLAAVLAPCRSAGVHGEASRPNRDLAWQKSLFARACWEEKEKRGGNLKDACALAAIQDDRRWKLVKPTARNYGNVRRWIRALGKTRDGTPNWGNYGKLVKGHGGGVQSTVQKEFLSSFAKAWLRQCGPNMKAVLDGLAVEFRRVGKGHLVPSYDALASYVREKMPADVVAKYRSPKGAWGDKFMGFVRRRCNCEVGDVIYGDHRIADVWVKALNDQDEWVAVRPYMTAWMDARSGYITAATMYTAEHPNHRSILDAFLLHIRNCGNRVPQKIYVDNGADFLFRGFSRPVRLAKKRGKEILADSEGEPYDYCVLDALGVELVTAAPYNGQEKPVERLFLDFARGWEQPWAPGYTGNSPRNRPDQMLTWKGDVDRLPTLQQAQDDLNYWIETIGHERIREEGRTRGEMWREADFGHLVEFTETDLQYRMLVPQAITPLVCRVGMGPGIRFANWEYGHEALAAHWGKPVMVKIPWRVPTTERQIFGGKKVGKTRRQVPVGVCVFTPDDVLIAVCPAVPQVDMFATEADQLEELGAYKHMINAIGARTTDRFEELTGRRQMVSDPRRVLAEVSGAASERPAVRQIVAAPMVTRKTRRLKGDGGGDGRIQESGFRIQEGGVGNPIRQAQGLRGMGEEEAVQSDFTDEEMESVHQVLVGAVVSDDVDDDDDFGPVDAGMFGSDKGDDPWAD